MIYGWCSIKYAELIKEGNVIWTAGWRTHCKFILWLRVKEYIGTCCIISEGRQFQKEKTRYKKKDKYYRKS